MVQLQRTIDLHRVGKWARVVYMADRSEHGVQRPIRDGPSLDAFGVIFVRAGALLSHSIGLDRLICLLARSGVSCET